MGEEIYGVITFHSTTQAVQAEKICKKSGFETRLIPVPRQISSDCGVCIRFLRPDQEDVLKMLNENRVEISKVVLI